MHSVKAGHEYSFSLQHRYKCSYKCPTFVDKNSIKNADLY